MSNNSENNDEEKEVSNIESLTWDELIQLEQAAEAGDIDAQKRLVEAEGVESFEEYRKLNQKVILEIEGNPDFQSAIASIVDPSELAKAFEALNPLKADQNELTKMAAMFDALKLNPEIDHINDLIGRTAALMLDRSNFMEGVNKSQIGDLIDNMTEKLSPAPNYVSAAPFMSYYVNPQEQVVNELAESNRLNREILNQMKKQELQGTEQSPNLQGKLEKIRAVNIAFEVLDAATERCFLDNTPSTLKIYRKPITTGSIAYELYEAVLRYLGKVIIRKTGNKQSLIEVVGSPLPDNDDVIQYRYHEIGWRIEGGFYHIHKGHGFETIHESELIPHAKELQEKRRKYLLETIVPAYLDRLSKEKLWNAGQHPRKIEASARQVGSRVKPGRPYKRKNKIPAMPKRKADAYRWVLVWELVEPKIQDDPSLKIGIDELVQYLKLNNLPVKEDTLRKIVARGTAGRMLSRMQFERENQM